MMSHVRKVIAFLLIGGVAANSFAMFSSSPHENKERSSKRARIEIEINEKRDASLGNLAVLPDELVGKIIDSLPHQERGQVDCVSKHMRYTRLQTHTSKTIHLEKAQSLNEVVRYMKGFITAHKNHITSLKLTGLAPYAEVVIPLLKKLPCLRDLDVSEQNLGVIGAQLIGQHLRQLTSLDVSRNQIGDDGAQALSTLINLRTLDVSSNQIGDAGAKALSTLRKLISLSVYRNQIGDDGAQALSALINLRTLDVCLNEIGDDGARWLSALRNLTSLNVSINDIGAEGARWLSALRNLTSLDVRNNQIGDDGAQALSALINLRTLDVCHNDIGDDGAQALSALINLDSVVTRYWPIGQYT